MGCYIISPRNLLHANNGSIKSGDHSKVSLFRVPIHLSILLLLSPHSLKEWVCPSFSLSPGECRLDFIDLSRASASEHRTVLPEGWMDRLMFLTSSSTTGNTIVVAEHVYASYLRI